MEKGIIKIRKAERGRMIARLLAKGVNIPPDEVISASDRQLLQWMFETYGPHHHKAWKIIRKGF